MDHQVNKLKMFLKDKDWYFDIQRDSLNRVVVYTTYQNYEVLTTVPDYVDHSQVVIHFASALGSKEKYATPVRLSSTPREEEELSSELLSKELDKLANVCGWDTLTDIFNEVHANDSATTEYSKYFASVNKSLTRLYSLYGSDVIMDALRIS